MSVTRCAEIIIRTFRMHAFVTDSLDCLPAVITRRGVTVVITQSIVHLTREINNIDKLFVGGKSTYYEVCWMTDFHKSVKGMLLGNYIEASRASVEVCPEHNMLAAGLLIIPCSVRTRAIQAFVAVSTYSRITKVAACIMHGGRRCCNGCTGPFSDRLRHSRRGCQRWRRKGSQLVFVLNTLRYITSACHQARQRGTGVIDGGYHCFVALHLEQRVNWVMNRNRVRFANCTEVIVGAVRMHTLESYSANRFMACITGRKVFDTAGDIMHLKRY